jgi:superfamily I DNA and RNA helicase
MSNWIVPYNKLDDQQKDFVDNVDFNQKNVWIKGFPGSGKSVLLAHTIAKIKRESPQCKHGLSGFHPLTHCYVQSGFSRDED